MNVQARHLTSFWHIRKGDTLCVHLYACLHACRHARAGEITCTISAPVPYMLPNPLPCRVHDVRVRARVRVFLNVRGGWGVYRIPSSWLD